MRTRQAYLDRHRKPSFGSVQINQAHPLARGLVNGWLFNEGAGAPFDIVSPQYPVALAGTTVPTWVSRGRGLAMNFGGTGYLTLSPPAEPAAGPISIFSYLYPTVADFNQFMGRNGNNNWRVRMNNDRTVTILDRGGTNTLTSTGTMPLNTWTSVGAVMDAAGLAIYLNGRLDTSSATAFGGGGTSSQLCIGMEGFVVAEFWQGLMDAPLKWNRRLTGAEFLWLHNDPYAFLMPKAPRIRYRNLAAVTKANPIHSLTLLGVGL